MDDWQSKQEEALQSQRKQREQIALDVIANGGGDESCNDDKKETCETLIEDDLLQCAFLAYSQKKRSVLKQDNQHLRFTEISKLLADLWRDAPDDIRREYIEQQSEQRERYKLEMDDWQSKQEEALQSQRKQREQIALDVIANGGGDESCNDGEKETCEPFVGDDPLQCAHQSEKTIANDIDGSTSSECNHDVAGNDDEILTRNADEPTGNEELDVIKRNLKFVMTELKTVKEENKAIKRENAIVKKDNAKLAERLQYIEGFIQSMQHKLNESSIEFLV